ncbi:MAG: hypothetical protein R3B13_23710 [Polyangiaceae bacterium]
MLGHVSNDRLTRQELSWLLAQEARGAARALREGVTLLSQPPPAGEPKPEVSTSLDALDDAISRLGELQLGTASKARRGRIDLAALLCEIAPHARIAMEPGAGVEVMGEEGEMRRMLHLLVSQTNASGTSGAVGGSDVEIRRQGTWVKVSVDLGPDASPTAEIERRWLSRMATRHGGRLELEGGVQTMWLPADDAGNEVAELKRELEQAQQLGEAYARELAQVFSSGTLTSAPPPPLEAGEAGHALEAVVGAVAAMERLMGSLLDGVRSDLNEPDAQERIQKRLSAAGDLLGELGHVAVCPLTDDTDHVDAAAIVAEVVQEQEARAARVGVKLHTVLPDVLRLETRPGVLKSAVHCMVDHALAASPRGAQVDVLLSAELPFDLRVIDGGPLVPEPAREDLLRRRLDPSSLGRPDGVGLVVAHCAAGVLGGRLSVGEAAGRAALVLRL